MYQCRKCGHNGNKPARIYEPDCISSALCENCGSDDIAQSSISCSICGRALYDGETAYETGNMLICPECITEVTV